VLTAGTRERSRKYRRVIRLPQKQLLRLHHW
jgi:hypothetical protein